MDPVCFRWRESLLRAIIADKFAETQKWRNGSRAGLTTGTKAHKIRVRLLCRSVRRNCPLVQRQDSRFWICLSGFESLGGNQTFEAIPYLSGCGRVRKSIRSQTMFIRAVDLT